jgi:hypothetical protein
MAVEVDPDKPVLVDKHLLTSLLCCLESHLSFDCSYINTPVEVDPDKPVLVDNYLLTFSSLLPHYCLG